MAAIAFPGDVTCTVQLEPGASPIEPSRREPSLELPAERYRLGSTIGKGGMGEVIAADDVQIGRTVAIKRMRMAVPTQDAMRQFLHEARIQGRLEHPSIPPVH